MPKRIVFIDGIRVITEEIDKVFSEIIRDAEFFHIVDEGTLHFDSEDKRLKRRFCNLALSAEEIGADVIVVTCGHGVPSMPILQAIVETPVVNVTLPMIEAAVNAGQTIGLVSTEETIVKPIVELLEKAGERANKKITIKVGLCEEAFRARLSGDLAKFDELVIKMTEEVSKTVDVVVLAQVSSCRVLPKVKDRIDKPILSPLITAAEEVRTILDLKRTRHRMAI